MSRQSYSIVEDYAKEERHACGYCKSPNTNFSHGMWAHSLTVQDYQNLIDRGWRRSGSYCYKPTMDKTCCPMYTIKCEAMNFKISKSQKKILKRVTKFLRNELKKDDMDINEDQHDNTDINFEQIPNKQAMMTQKNISEINISSIEYESNKRANSNTLNTEKRSCELLNEQNSGDAASMSNSDQTVSVALEATSTTQTENNFSNIPCKKAKLLRIERKQKKLLAQGKSLKEIETIFKESKQQNYTKNLEELFEEILTGTKKLEMKLTKVMSNEFLNSLDASASLYKKYQMAIHGDEPEECNKRTFINFLVKTPLQQWIPENGPPQGYGSFHEQYWLDNELIAVGVIDILPSCISSVYFFYDPEYSFLSLGTFSSLREVYLTRQLNKVASNLKYYYMGFYIHTCPKMRYKTRMKPSKLLCPETYVWCDVESCLAKLDKEKYCRLNEDIDAIDEDGVVDINKMLILYGQRAMPYRIYKTRVHRDIVKQEEDKLKEYASLVGMKCAQSLLLCRG